MTKNNTLRVIDNICCSHRWLKPIAHKPNRSGIAQFGLELEFHAFEAQTFKPLTKNDSDISPQSILAEIAHYENSSSLIFDDTTNEIIGLKLNNGGNFSLEPGGQIEFASMPATNLQSLIDNIHHGLQLLEYVTKNSIVFLSHGTNPITLQNHPLVVPKKRYQFMTRYFESAPQKIRGIDMMRHSATVQPNLDILDADDWHNAVNLILQLLPITSLMFANSRYFQGKKSKFYSERQNIWQNMDPTRSGIPTNLLADSAFHKTSCAYAKWAKDAYVIFIDGLPLDEQPKYGELTFAHWFEQGYKTIYPTVSHWETHLTTLFPHLRLRNFLEIRNIDAQPFEHSLAPLVFFKALLSNRATQDKTKEILNQTDYDMSKNFLSYQEVINIGAQLLDLACENLLAYQNQVGLASLQVFKNFLVNRENYWHAEDALSFVKNHATPNPAQNFVKYF